MSSTKRFTNFIHETDRKVLLIALFMLSPLFIGLVGSIFVRDDGLLRELLARAYAISNIITMIIFLSIAFMVAAFQGEGRRGSSGRPMDTTAKVAFIGSALQAVGMWAAWFWGAQGSPGLLHVIPGLVAAVTLLTLIWVSEAKR